jgi:hypothetical protein
LGENSMSLEFTSHDSGECEFRSGRAIPVAVR